MNMDPRKIAFLGLIALFLLCAGCVESPSNSADHPTPTLVQVTTPVSSPTPAAVNSDMITGTWVCHSRFNDIITLVSIALGNAPISDCVEGDPNHDGQIAVDEILAAVNNALNGCG